jgi:hypothetical protein
MKMRFLVIVTINLLMFGAGYAQHWTAEEQEVLAHIRTCWKGWQQAADSKELSAWTKVCPSLEGFGYWLPGEGAPLVGSDAMNRWVDSGTERMFYKHVSWNDVRPQAITISNNTALVHFYALFAFEDSEGKPQRLEEKRFEVFQKINGIWTFAGGMITPAP